ncbi:MAG: hypothetical protein U0133_01355 [Gemmatimonadales bacterium]
MPMIDIMPGMLIIFMVSPLARMALDVQVLPQEQASKSNANSNQIVLELTEDGGTPSTPSRCRRTSSTPRSTRSSTPGPPS